MAFPTVFTAVMHCFLPWLKWYVTNLVTRIIILLLVIIDAMALTTIYSYVGLLVMRTSTKKFSTSLKIEWLQQC